MESTINCTGTIYLGEDYIPRVKKLITKDVELYFDTDLNEYGEIKDRLQSIIENEDYLREIVGIEYYFGFSLKSKTEIELSFATPYSEICKNAIREINKSIK